MKKNTPMMIGVGVVVVLLIGGGVFIYKKLTASSSDNTVAQQPQKKRITDPVNIVAENDRPYVTVSPKDIHNITLKVNELKKPATSADFELEYQTGTNLEGAVGAIALDHLPAAKDILLGSCSAGGACRYHEEVAGGTLLLKFSGGPDSYTLKQDWKYIENKTRETQFSSKDAYFQIESKDLGLQKILIIYNTPGFPKNLTGTAVSEGYTVSALTPLQGSANVTIRMKEDAPKAVIMGYDGQNWKEFPTKVDGKTATATVNLVQLYVAVKK